MNRVHGSKDFWIGALRSEGPAFRAAVAEAAPDTPVLSCPGWTIADLTTHLATLYAWVVSVADRADATAPAQRPAPPESAQIPDGLTALEFWQREYDRLLELLERVDPEQPAWNWAPQPKKVAFWARRMAHETAIHRWDAEMAIAAGQPIETKLAADGITEVLDTFLPAGHRRAEGEWQGLVRLTSTDAHQEWYVRLRGRGVALLDTGTILDNHAHPALVQVTGTASDLLLALYGRVGLDSLGVQGDRHLIDGLRVG